MQRDLTSSIAFQKKINVVHRQKIFLWLFEHKEEVKMISLKKGSMVFLYTVVIGAIILTVLKFIFESISPSHYVYVVCLISIFLAMLLEYCITCWKNRRKDHDTSQK